jgi:NACHT domain
LDAKIREMPYRGGWRFNDKRCLPGIREGFLDYIIKWVENPESERALVLLGQAGTGKSSIAHEIARRFDGKCLGSYFAFLRKEQSKDEAYQLFTTLARDLSDRSPAFKRALGRVIKDKSSLRGTRDYHTLFECLLLEPLKTVPLPSPVLIVIDALDESGATIDRNGLHAFLAQRLIDLPPNFRILITSRPESGIEPAFANAGSVRTIYMDDTELAANTEQDIGMYLRKELPEDVFKDYGGKLAKAAEGLFQWAAVACGFINSPASLGLSKKECVQHLLGHSRERDDQGPLDNLYEEVLKEYFKSHKAQIVFRSVMGQLLAAIEPLSISSLIVLRRHGTKDDPEDSDRVHGILGYLGSLLSNVTSADQTRPIVPLHTSFRDFLTSKTSDVFYVDLGDAHHQLAHSCLTIMLDNLKFNICKLESSHLANSDVPDLKSRIAKYIPPDLSYACIYWDDHLGYVSFEHELFKKLRSLLETKFLFWLEVLSVKNSVGVASPALSSLSMWLQPEVGTS